MNAEDRLTDICIMGKTYQIKCSAQEVESLKASARYVEEKMQKLRENTLSFGLEKIAVITALNIAHEFLHIEDIIDQRTSHMQQKLRDLNEKVESALLNISQMEFSSAE